MVGLIARHASAIGRADAIAAIRERGKFSGSGSRGILVSQRRLNRMLDLSRLTTLSALALCISSLGAPPARAQTPHTWTADNGNGTFTNPLFFDEFSDPDIIHVGDWFYLTGTTMHAMPGLPVMRSKDLVNWEFLSYAAPALDFGPEFRL